MEHGGPEPLTVTEMLLITLYYLANPCSIRVIADKFGRGEATVWRSVHDVTHCLSENQENFIKWPNGREISVIASEFQAKSGFPGIIAAVDGCHIKIHPPVNNQKDYLNYKRFHSIVLMAFVGPKKEFSYISVGFPGSNHDSYVLQRSLWWDRVTNDVNKFFQSPDYHAVGDSAFPLTEFLLVPYKQQVGMTKPMKVFNKKLSAARVTVERAFGDLKNRFRRCLDIQGNISTCVNVVSAACCVHNFCIANGDFEIEETTTADLLLGEDFTSASPPG